MKKLFTLLALVLTLITFAQAPQGFNYQATVRNSAGALIVNQNVNFKFNIMLNSATSLPIFSETHLAPTDDLGQVNLVIGTGTATTGSFSTINWGSGNYYLGIELNTGAGYIAMGTTQLLSVPYALYANTAGNSQSSIPNLPFHPWFKSFVLNMGCPHLLKIVSSYELIFAILIIGLKIGFNPVGVNEFGVNIRGSKYEHILFE